MNGCVSGKIDYRYYSFMDYPLPCLIARFHYFPIKMLGEHHFDDFPMETSILCYTLHIYIYIMIIHIYNHIYICVKIYIYVIQCNTYIGDFHMTTRGYNAGSLLSCPHRWVPPSLLLVCLGGRDMALIPHCRHHLLDVRGILGQLSHAVTLWETFTGCELENGHRNS